MARQEYVCFQCDNHFTIKADVADKVKFCPYCGSDLELEDCNDFEDEE